MEIADIERPNFLWFSTAAGTLHSSQRNRQNSKGVDRKWRSFAGIKGETMQRISQTVVAACIGLAAIIALAVPVITVPAAAETINVSDSHGGSVADYSARWAGLAARGVNVRVVGPCRSACTVLLGHIPRSRICVTPAASFGFHLAHLSSASAMLWSSYQPDIQAWINQHGGLQREFIWLRAPETYRFFHKCG
jgi:hypothetical protein